MTSEEVSEVLHVDPVTIRRLVNKGDLSAYRIGADYRFAPSDVDDYLQRQRVSARTGDASGAGANNPLDQLTQLMRKVLQAKFTTPAEVVDRFDRFTKRARHVLTLAQEEARSFQHNYIGTEHLLLGLVREGEGIAAQVLRNLGVEVNQVRSAVEAIIGRGDRIVLGEVGFTPRAKKVIELAVDEARRLNHRFIGTEHLLLGLIREGEGIASGVLESLGVRLDQARTEVEVLLALRQHKQEEAPAAPPVPAEATELLAEEEQRLDCANCGARSPGYFRYCFNCGQMLVREDAG